MISYKPFQKLLIDRGLKKRKVMEVAGISNATMAKLNTTEYVSLEVIDKLCAALDCQPGDLLEYVSDKAQEVAETNTPQEGLYNQERGYPATMIRSTGVPKAGRK